MKIQEIYEQMGIDYDQILDRFGDEELLRKYLNKFMKEQSFVKLQESMEKGNAEEAFEAVHALKGICLTLGFRDLYTASCKLTEVLRNGKLSGSDEPYQEVISEYQRLIMMIETIE